MTRMDRNFVSVKRQEKEEEFEKVEGESSYLFGVIWSLTQDAWAFRGGEDAKRRLQRHVTNLIRRES